MDKHAAQSNVAVCRARKHAVEPIKKPSQRSLAPFSRPEQKGRQRRTQSEGIESGKDNGNGDRYSELLIETSRDSRNKRCWNEYGGEY